MAKVIGKDETKSQPTIDLGKSKAMLCQNCGDQVFVAATIFRKIPKLIAGSQKDAIVPIEVFLCSSCGELIDELLPPELRVKK